MRLAAVTALVLSGCTIIGAVDGSQRARNANQRRERAIAKGEPNPPAERSVVNSAVIGGVIGLAVDVVVLYLAVIYLVPKD